MAVNSANFNAHLTRSSSDRGATERIRPDIASKIQRVEPQGTPLLTLTESVTGRVRSVHNRQFEVQEEWPIVNETTVTATEPAAETSIAVADGSIFRTGMTGFNTRTGDHFVVTTGGSTPLTVIRGTGTTAAAIWLSGDRLLSTGYALEEGQDKLAAWMRAPNMYTNYTQKFFHAAALTDVMMDSGFYGESENQRLNTQVILEFKKGIERGLLFGEPNKDTSGTHPRWNTGGAKYFCKLYNQVNMGGGVTVRSWAHLLQQASRFGSEGGQSFKVIMAGQKVHAILSELPHAMGIERVPMGTSKIGDDVTEIRFPGGTAALVLNYNFEGAGLDDVALILDPRYMGLAEFGTMEMENNVQTPGSQRKEWQLTRTLGLEVTLPAAFAYAYNIQFAAA